MTHTDIELARREPVQVIRPSGPRRRSKGDPSGTAVITTILAILVITALFAGFLGTITRDML